MRLLSRMSLPLLLLALALAGPAVGSASAYGPSDVVGHVYLNDNTSITNTIAAFARHADGTLTALPGSPFAAGGAGAGKGLASQGALQVADYGRYLLAVDAGSNQISVLRINHDGSLEPVSIVSSGGVDPDSIAVHGDLVYVANGNADDIAGGTNYTGFILGYDGHLYPLRNSTVNLSDTAAPGDVLFNGDGTKLIGTEVGPSVIDSFTVGWKGLLTAAPGSPFTAQGLGPFGSEFRPTNPNQLFVTNAHNGTGLGTVSAFNDSFNGTLSSIGSSPFADSQTAPCWLIISHDGRFLFAVNTGSGEISSYAIAFGGELTLLGSTPVGDTGGVGAVDPGLSPDGRYLYVNETRIDSVGIFFVNGGNLTELASSPTALPAGATPAGIVVN
ncbi:MAG: beta-propeller fold lactonase family protein [Solirubrobacteraceae bacterium]